MIITGTELENIRAGNKEFIDEYFVLDGLEKCTLRNLQLNKLKLQTVDLTNCVFPYGAYLRMDYCEVDNLILPKNTNTLEYRDDSFYDTQINNLTVSSDFIYTSNNNLFSVIQNCTFLEEVTSITARINFYYAEGQSVVIKILSKNITEIRSKAFYWMYKVKEIYCHSETAPLIYENSFYSWGNEPINVYVPQNATGYDEGLWLQLQTDGHITISYTL